MLLAFGLGCALAICSSHSRLKKDRDRGMTASARCASAHARKPRESAALPGRRDGPLARRDRACEASAKGGKKQQERGDALQDGEGGGDFNLEQYDVKAFVARG